MPIVISPHAATVCFFNVKISTVKVLLWQHEFPGTVKKLLLRSFQVYCGFRKYLISYKLSHDNPSSDCSLLPRHRAGLLPGLWPWADNQTS
jgi:hypothetical protein